MRVKLMADYGAFPLWGPGGELAPDALPLPPWLVAALRDWADEHDRLLGPAFEWPSEEAKAAFVAGGRRLFHRVRAELGPGYQVVYFNEITGRVEER
ncbi:hypothetical protein ACQP2F_05575 [Actinoplanes sp. CA-030573]|uniref:hypothetical protein n=1 Tax=Actinoplanes sp. CA-030573 TaxID=3239898 RepID=UPI003D9173F3